jgi:hypothetical protein
MTANSALVLAGIAAGGTTGYELLYVAPTGTAAPVDATTDLNASFESCGYISSDGVTLGVDESSEDIQAYGTGVPVRTINTSSKQTLSVVCLETNPTVLEVYSRKALGTIAPDAEGDFTITEGAVPTQRYSFVVEVKDGTNYMRFYYPSAEVTDRQELTVANGQSIQYGFTITAYPAALTGIAVSKFYRIPDLAGS